MSWLETKFPTTPIGEIEIDYFRKLESDVEFQKQKKEIISEAEKDIDYYVTHIIIAHIENVKHIDEFTQIINEQLFKDVKYFKKTLDDYIEGSTKMKKSIQPDNSEFEAPPAYEP
jgi:hypothetical protein